MALAQHLTDPRTLLKRYGLTAKRHMGQNFLVSPHIPAQIALDGGCGQDDVAFEIGAGTGALTRALAERAKRVIAIEHDRDLVALLKKEFEGVDNVEVREANVLDLDWTELRSELGGPPVIYGNLPYHMSTPVLVRLLARTRAWRRGCFLLQREFAERAATPPGERGCSRLSALVALWSRARIARRVPATAFHPRPKVESSVLVLEPRPEPAVDVDPKRFGVIVGALFAKRRKTARNALRGVVVDADAALSAAGIDPMRRGETLCLAELAALCASP